MTEDPITAKQVLAWAGATLGAVLGWFGVSLHARVKTLEETMGDKATHAELRRATTEAAGHVADRLDALERRLDERDARAWSRLDKMEADQSAAAQEARERGQRLYERIETVRKEFGYVPGRLSGRVDGVTSDHGGD